MRRPSRYGFLLFAALLLLDSSAFAAGLGGTIREISRAQGTLLLAVGKEAKLHPLRMAADVRITLDGKPAGLDDLQPGQWAFVTTTDDRATTVAARAQPPTAPGSSSIEAEKPRLEPRPKDSSARRPAAPVEPKAAIDANPPPAGGNPAPWPQFLGPLRNNVSAETGLLASWPPPGPKLAWVARGLGEGLSSLAVAGGKVLTLGNHGDKEVILAFDFATGNLLWTMPHAPAFSEEMFNGPRSVPTIDGNLVYALSAVGILSCAELSTGRIRWQMNPWLQFGGSMPKWGICESVLVDAGRVICTPGGRATMVAIDKLTGQPVWGAATPAAEAPGYASAIVATVGGVRQYVQFTSRGTLGVCASDGLFLWEDATSANDTANCSAPLFFDDGVFTASAYGAGGALLKLATAGGRTLAMPVYATKSMQSQHGGMVVVDGYIYGSSEPGILTCLEWKTGRVMWENRSVGKASLTCADGRLYVRGEQRVVALVEASPRGYHETGRFQPPQPSDEPAWSYPVVANGKLLLRDGDLLFCYDVLRGTAPAAPSQP